MLYFGDSLGDKLDKRILIIYECLWSDGCKVSLTRYPSGTLENFPQKVCKLNLCITLNTFLLQQVRMFLKICCSLVHFKNSLLVWVTEWIEGPLTAIFTVGHYREVGVCGEYDLSFSRALRPQGCPNSAWAHCSLQCSGRTGRWCCLPLIYSMFITVLLVLSKRFVHTGAVC